MKAAIRSRRRCPPSSPPPPATAALGEWRWIHFLLARSSRVQHPDLLSFSFAKPQKKHFNQPTGTDHKLAFTVPYQEGALRITGTRCEVYLCTLCQTRPDQTRSAQTRPEASRPKQRPRKRSIEMGNRKPTYSLTRRRALAFVSASASSGYGTARHGTIRVQSRAA